MKSFGPPKKSNFMHGLNSFLEIGWPYPQKRLAEIFFVIYTTYFNFCYFFEYETVVRISASSFGDSDPDPSSVTYLD